jgi:hypothetical protein
MRCTTLPRPKIVGRQSDLAGTVLSSIRSELSRHHSASSFYSFIIRSMAPLRGTSSAQTANDDDIAVQQQGNSALVNAKRNFRFLVSPETSTDRPNRLRTRALLRTVRYVGQFIIWKLVRWAKYAAVGALVAAIGATAFGSVISGVAWIAAPTSITASILAATIWGVGKFAARRLHRRWKRTGQDTGEAEREYQSDHPLKREGTLGHELGPQAVPW